MVAPERRAVLHVGPVHSAFSRARVFPFLSTSVKVSSVWPSPSLTQCRGYGASLSLHFPTDEGDGGSSPAVAGTRLPVGLAWF